MSSAFEFVFMADCQLGAYATFSGMNEADVARYAERGMRVEIVPGVEGYAWDAERYRTAIAAVNALEPEFVVMGGDMVDDPASQEQYETLMEITAALDHDIAMHWVPGNHDIADDTVVPTPERIATYRDAFGPDYYAFDHGGVRFIVLNTVVVDHPERSSDALAEQMEFLREEIDRVRNGDGTGIVFGHHPLFTREPNEEDTYWNLPRDRRRNLLAEFHRGRISHAFAGHWHRNSVARDGAFEMVTSGPVGYPLGDDPSGIRVVRVESGRVVHHRYHSLAEFEEGAT
jgi:3',5'-cyclic AMP phosphodiesterase CpdA